MAQTSVPGISTIGITVHYGIETSPGIEPTNWNQLTRINAIAGINVEVETIDASALEDEIEKAVAGRGTTGGSFNVTVNSTRTTIGEWSDFISAYKTAKASGLSAWVKINVPSLGDYKIVAEPPSVIPMPEMGQNSLLTTDMTMSINDYKGITLSE